MPDVLADYFAALERLRNGRPTKVPLGTRITNDAVAIEAGRGRGSIKRSRVIFFDLIRAIERAGEDQSRASDDGKKSLEKAKAQVKSYRKLYEDALSRELSLVHEIRQLKKRLNAKK